MPGIVSDPTTGEVRAVIDPTAPSPAEPKPAEPTRESPDILTEPQPGSPAAAHAALEAMLADKTHPAWDLSHPMHAEAQKQYLDLVMAERGEDAADPTVNKVIGEVFEGGRLRPPGAAALSPAPRPVLPEGHAWDEGALVLGEIEAHACGLAPHVVMQTTDELATVIESGVEWSPELGEAELVRRHGREGAQQMADRARMAYETIIESEHPLLVQRVKELARDYGSDPNVVAIFAGLYREITSAPMTPKLEALLLRRTERAMQAEAKARATGEQIRREHDAEGDEARAASLAGVALAHRRWSRSEP